MHSNSSADRVWLRGQLLDRAATAMLHRRLIRAITPTATLPPSPLAPKLLLDAQLPVSALNGVVNTHPNGAAGYHLCTGYFLQLCCGGRWCALRPQLLLFVLCSVLDFANDERAIAECATMQAPGRTAICSSAITCQTIITGTSRWER